MEEGSAILSALENRRFPEFPCPANVRNVDHKTKVLMLDDERFLLDIYKTTFERKGYDVSIHSDADDALKALRGGYKPDVILFDITMPDGKSGYEFMEIVRAEKLAKHSLKIALTNEGQDGEVKRMGELGADGHILKARFIPSELETEVTGMLKMKVK